MEKCAKQHVCDNKKTHFGSRTAQACAMVRVRTKWLVAPKFFGPFLSILCVFKDHFRGGFLGYDMGQSIWDTEIQ